MRIAHVNEDTWPALARILGLCFGIHGSRWSQWQGRLGNENTWMIEENGKVLGGLGIYPVGQWFGGRSLRMAGVAGVGVAPEARGRDVALKLLSGVLRQQREAGVPLAGLYASTQVLYRKIGFEIAANRIRYQADVATIGRWPRVEIREVEGSELLKPRQRVAHGNLDRSEVIWERILEPQEGQAFSFLVGDDGYVVYKTADADHGFDLEILDSSLPSAQSLQGFLAFVNDQRSMAGHLRWVGPTQDPIVASLPEATWKIKEMERYMLRILDLKAAVEGRGWTGRSGTLHLEILDGMVAENNGCWKVEVDGGEARLTRGGRGDLRMDIRAFAPLYSGLLDPFTLAQLGWVEGDASALQTASGLFLGPEPWIREHF